MTTVFDRIACLEQQRAENRRVKALLERLDRAERLGDTAEIERIFDEPCPADVLDEAADA
jgi:hypothetical protein